MTKKMRGKGLKEYGRTRNMNTKIIQVKKWSTEKVTNLKKKMEKGWMAR